MTALEVIEAAFAECASFFEPQTTASSVFIRRLNVRQQELFTLAAQANPAYYGVAADATLDANGGCDLLLLTGSPNAAHRLQRVEILDPGTSGYNVGRKVSIVDVDDPIVALAPRMALRDHALYNLGTDMDGVTTVRIYYSKGPDLIDEESDTVDMNEPHTELLVWDLAKQIVRRDPSVGDSDRNAASTFFAGEEERALEVFVAHVQSFGATVSRFD